MNDLLKGQDKFTVEDFQRFQLDVKSIYGERIIEEVLAILNEGGVPEDEDVRLGMRLLREWDMQLDVDTIGGTVYEVLKYTTNKNLFEPRLGTDLMYLLLGVSP